MLLEKEEDKSNRNLLTAPPQEMGQPNNQTSKLDQGDADATTQLWNKQMELVNEQLKLQKILLENAMIAKYEAKKRLKMSIAQRKIAEMDLQLRENALGEINEQ